VAEISAQIANHVCSEKIARADRQLGEPETFGSGDHQEKA
jgi:hypothetical protein